MAINLISNITQKNNGDFWLVDSNAIYGGLYHVQTTAERNNLPTKRLKVGMLCYVQQEDVYYKYTVDKTWAVFTTGGAGSGDIIDDEEKEDLKNIFGTDES